MATTTLTPAASAYRNGLYEWLTTTDHKKIGIMYLVNSFTFFAFAGALAMLMRTQLAVFEAVNAIDPRYVPYAGSISAPPDASTDAAAAASNDVIEIS